MGGWGGVGGWVGGVGGWVGGVGGWEGGWAPAPAMAASAGYGQAVHSGKCAMHTLGIQVLPSPGMMAIMDAKDTMCKVTLLQLSIRSEDMLIDYTADESATGFKKRPASQLRGIKQNRGSSCEGIWITKKPPGST